MFYNLMIQEIVSYINHLFQFMLVSACQQDI